MSMMINIKSLKSWIFNICFARKSHEYLHSYAMRMFVIFEFLWQINILMARIIHGLCFILEWPCPRLVYIGIRQEIAARYKAFYMMRAYFCLCIFRMPFDFDILSVFRASTMPLIHCLYADMIFLLFQYLILFGFKVLASATVPIKSTLPSRGH